MLFLRRGLAPCAHDPAGDPPVDLKNPWLAAFLAWLVPGLGHAYQGRRGKAILYFVCIMGLFVVGMVVGDGKAAYWRWVSPLKDAENFRISYVFQLFTGLAALPGLIQATLREWGLSPILWGFMDAPPLTEVYGLHPRLGKLVEIGWIYTVIAGLLNVLAIYDAFAGPALEAETSPDEATSLATASPTA